MNNKLIKITEANINQYFIKLNKHLLFKNAFIDKTQLHASKDNAISDSYSVLENIPSERNDNGYNLHSRTTTHYHMINPLSSITVGDDFSTSMEIDDGDRNHTIDYSVKQHLEAHVSDNTLDEIFDENAPYMTSQVSIQLNNIQNNILFHKDIIHFLHSYHERYSFYSNEIKQIDNNIKIKEFTNKNIDNNIISENFSSSDKRKKGTKIHSLTSSSECDNQKTNSTYWDRIQEDVYPLISRDDHLSLFNDNIVFTYQPNQTTIANSYNVPYDLFGNNDNVTYKRSLFSQKNYSNQVTNISYLFNGYQNNSSGLTSYDSNKISQPYIPQNIRGSSQFHDGLNLSFTLLNECKNLKFLPPKNELLISIYKNGEHCLDKDDSDRVLDIINEKVSLKNNGSNFNDVLNFFNEDQYRFEYNTNLMVFKPLEIDMHKQPNINSVCINSQQFNRTIPDNFKKEYQDSKEGNEKTFSTAIMNHDNVSDLWKRYKFSYDSSITNNTCVDQNNFITISEANIVNNLVSYTTHYNSDYSKTSIDISESVLTVELTHPSMDKEQLEYDLETLGTVDSFKPNNHIEPCFLLKSIYNGMLLDIFYINDQVDNDFIKNNIYNYIFNFNHKGKIERNSRNQSVNNFYSTWPVTNSDFESRSMSEDVNTNNTQLNFINNLYLNKCLFHYVPNSNTPYYLNNNLENRENVKYKQLTDKNISIINDTFYNTGSLGTLVYTKAALAKYISNLTQAQINLVKDGVCYVYRYYLINNNDDEDNIDSIDDDQVLNTDNITMGFHLENSYKSNSEDKLIVITSLPKVYETIYKNHNNAVYNTINNSIAQSLWNMNHHITMTGDSNIVHAFNLMKNKDMHHYNDKSDVVTEMNMIHYSFSDIMGHENYYDFNNMELKNLLYHYKTKTDVLSEKILVSNIENEKNINNNKVSNIQRNISSIDNNIDYNSEIIAKNKYKIVFYDYSNNMGIYYDNDSIDFDNEFTNINFANDYIRNHSKFIKLQYKNDCSKDHTINKSIIVNAILRSLLTNNTALYDVYDMYGQIYKDLKTYDYIQTIPARLIEDYKDNDNVLVRMLSVYPVHYNSTIPDPVINNLSGIVEDDRVTNRDAWQILDERSSGSSLNKFFNLIDPDNEFFIDVVETMLEYSSISLTVDHIEYDVYKLILKILSEDRSYMNLALHNSAMDNMTILSHYINVTEEELDNIDETYSEFFESFMAFCDAITNRFKDFYNNASHIANVLLSQIPDNKKYLFTQKLMNIKPFVFNLNNEQNYDMFDYAVNRISGYNLSDLFNDHYTQCLKYKPVMIVVINNLIMDLNSNYNNAIVNDKRARYITNIPNNCNFEILRFNNLKKKTRFLNDESFKKNLPFEKRVGFTGMDYWGISGFDIGTYSRISMNTNNKDKIDKLPREILFVNHILGIDEHEMSFMLYCFSRQLMNIILFQKIFNACFMYKKNTTYKHIVDAVYDYGNCLDGTIDLNCIKTINDYSSKLSSKDLEDGDYPNIMTIDHYEKYHMKNVDKYKIQTPDSNKVDFVSSIFNVKNNNVVKMKKYKMSDYFGLCYLNIESRMLRINKSQVIDYYKNKRFTEKSFKQFLEDNNIVIDKNTVVMVIDDYKYDLNSVVGGVQKDRALYFVKNCDSLLDHT